MTTYPEPKAFPIGAQFTDGVWTQALSARAATENRPALFLDRDGVVVEEAHYLHNVEDVQLTPNAAKTIKTANDRNIPVILVTNQAGVGYGYFGWDDFVAVQERILSDLAQDGARVDGVFACPFHAKAKSVYIHDDHPARKPNPGMLLLAKDILGVDLQKSWIVGDRSLDVMAGKNAGLSGAVHVLTGHGTKEGEREAALAVADDTFTVTPATNLGEARALIPILA
ncbi:HAD family hydrolase [Magnetovibrio sp.]|uniref:D-glycero-alpha-D-manno-heptose-1,7-bisphosphate 7-phosphatase n=1 Tax=Magnetovibrio sp. TaxID=2024836 RepID=UPI002F94EFE1